MKDWKAIHDAWEAEDVRLATKAADSVVQGYRDLHQRHDMDAAHAFRYRLRELAKAALTLGDELLQLSQDASVPTEEQLRVIRGFEDSIDVCARIYLRELKPKVQS